MPKNVLIALVGTDASPKQELHENEWGRFAEGDYMIKSEAGNEVIKYSKLLSYNSGDKNQNAEILELLKRYAEVNGHYAASDISFMDSQTAVNFGKQIITQCGINLTPVLETCQALTHEQIMGWQQRLINDPDSYYNIFGKTMILSNLTEKDDVYFLRFNFEYNGIRILNFNTPNVSYADNALPPFPIFAEMLLTPDGLRYFNLYPAFEVSGNSESSTLISLDEALNLLKSDFDLVIHECNYKVNAIYLEYVPVQIEGKPVLTPYWCFELVDEVTNNDGTTYWSDFPVAYRFNAFTGKNITYGG